MLCPKPNHHINHYYQLIFRKLELIQVHMQSATQIDWWLATTTYVHTCMYSVVLFVIRRSGESHMLHIPV